MSRAAAREGLTRVKFCFDGLEDAAFTGWTDHSTWNGFLNVRVEPAERDAVAALFEGLGDEETASDVRSVPVGRDGLADLGGGFATLQVGRARKGDRA